MSAGMLENKYNGMSAGMLENKYKRITRSNVLGALRKVTKGVQNNAIDELQGDAPIMSRSYRVYTAHVAMLNFKLQSCQKFAALACSVIFLQFEDQFFWFKTGQKVSC